MPTVLFVHGWRFYFYANERNEPIHVHCRKGGKECKYWLLTDVFGIAEAYSYNLSPADKRQVRKIIFAHFEYIESEWNNFKGGRR